MFLFLIFSLHVAWASDSSPSIIAPSALSDRYEIPAPKDVIVPLAPKDSTVATLPVRFNFLTWNIHKASGGESWARDLEKLSSDSHITIFQEAMKNDFVKSTLSEVAKESFWMAQSFIFSNGDSTGVSTGSVANLKNIQAFRSPSLEPVTNTPKTTLITAYQMKDGVPLLLVNLHGINFTTADHLKAQLEAIRPTVEKFQGRKIFAGDFNTWNASRLTVVQEFMQSLNLQAVEFKVDPRKQRLDHVFMSGCHAEESTILSQITSSDHFPIRVAVLCP